MALSHVRNVEVFALLAPLVVAGPVAAQFALAPASFARLALPAASSAVLAALVAAATWALAATHPFAAPMSQAPETALNVLRDHRARRILNDLPFAGYLIAQGVPVFIDGRAELYGEAFVMAYYRAMQLKDVNVLLDLLKRYDIDAVVLTPATPAVSFMDHAAGWQRIYADDNAVVHLRAKGHRAQTQFRHHYIRTPQLFFAHSILRQLPPS